MTGLPSKLSHWRLPLQLPKRLSVLELAAASAPSSSLDNSLRSLRGEAIDDEAEETDNEVGLTILLLDPKKAAVFEEL